MMKLLVALFIVSISLANGQVCRDIIGRTECTRWLSFSGSYCRNNAYIKKNCAFSCGSCLKSAVCRDRQPSLTCTYWRRRGYCVKGNSATQKHWYSIMIKSCPFTCGLCNTKKEEKKVITNVDCRNKNRNCNYWRQRDHCYRSSAYYSYMTTNCRLACGFCKVTKVVTTTLPPPPIVTTKELPKPPVVITKATTKATTTLPTTTPSTTTPSTTTPSTTTPSTTKTSNTIFPKECGMDKRTKIGSFIVDGTTAQANVWPWQVALYLETGAFHCGGTLITPQFVVTAAHCLENHDTPDGLTVRLGDHTRDTDEGPEQEIEVEGFVIHHDYDSILSYNHDIALIMLSKPAVLNKNVNVACLPQRNSEVDISSKCYVSGWGRMEADAAVVNKLQEAKLPVITKDKCGEKNKDSRGNSKITQNMVCAGNEDVRTSGCSGDSGGPFVCKSKENKWVLQGAVSWGPRSCDTRDKYTVFTKVSKYVDWIKDLIVEATSED